MNDDGRIKRVRLTHVASSKGDYGADHLVPGSTDFVSKVNTIRQKINLLRGKRNFRLRQMGVTTWLNPNQATVDDLLDFVVKVVNKA